MAPWIGTKKDLSHKVLPNKFVWILGTLFSGS